MRVLLNLLLVLGLCGLVGFCVYVMPPPPTAEEIRRDRERSLEEKLPAGCKATDLGSYGEVEQMVAIQCEGRTVVTTFEVVRVLSGKMTTSKTTGIANILPEGETNQ